MPANLYGNLSESTGSRSELIANTDTFIVESTVTGGWFVYDDFTSRVTKSGGNYSFNSTNPHHRFAPSDARWAPDSYNYQMGFGYSPNGRYIVFAAKDDTWGQYDSTSNITSNPYRYFIYDINTGTTKIFSVGKYDYDGSFNQTAGYKDFGISDDGQYVAGSALPHLNIWNIEGCTVAYTGVVDDTMSDDPCVPTITGGDSYQTVYGESNSIFNHVRNPIFTDENKGILFDYHDTSDSQVKSIQIYAPGYTPQRLNYLALGDSYSSGEGDTRINPANGQKYYRQGTDKEGDGHPREKCHLSTRSYPYKLAAGMNLNIYTGGSVQPWQQWQSVACSGAVIYDANYTNSSGYEGQYSGKGSAAFGRLHGHSVSQLQTAALNEMIPGREKQIKFVEKYKPRAVTLTMGGNDVDFAAKITDCISSAPCDLVTDEGKRSLGDEIKSQYSSLVSLYEEIKQGSPGVRVYVLGYPQVISSDPNANIYCPMGMGVLDASERKVIVEGYAYMNSIIEAAAEATGVKYIDVENALEGHQLCGSTNGPTYVTGLAWLMYSETQETFHPNADGHAAIANAVWDAVDNDSLLSYSGYPPSPATNVSIPESTYLQTTIAPNVTTRSKKMTDTTSTRGQTINIWTNLYMFLGGSQLAFTLHSDPINLGTVTVDLDGSVDANVTIPSTVPPGYHTLIVSGQTSSGEHIEYEQIILVKGEVPGDIDDDGISDDQQVCGPFITPANEDTDYDGIDDACDPEVTDPILYVTRNGDTTKSEDPDKIYIYRNTRASSLTGITADHVDISLDPDNKEALVAASLDTSTSATYNRFIMLEDVNDPNIKIPTILARDTTNTCIALQPTDYLSPALNPTDPNYTPRGFTKLTQLPSGEECD